VKGFSCSSHAHLIPLSRIALATSHVGSKGKEEMRTGRVGVGGKKRLKRPIEGPVSHRCEAVSKPSRGRGTPHAEAGGRSSEATTGSTLATSKAVAVVNGVDPDRRSEPQECSRLTNSKVDLET
jgi:hypothetical protein